MLAKIIKVRNYHHVYFQPNYYSQRKTFDIIRNNTISVESRP